MKTPPRGPAPMGEARVPPALPHHHLLPKAPPGRGLRKELVPHRDAHPCGLQAVFTPPHFSLLCCRGRGEKAVIRRPKLLRALRTISKASYTNYPITCLPLAFGTADPSHFLQPGYQMAPCCCTVQLRPCWCFTSVVSPLRHLLGAARTTGRCSVTARVLCRVPSAALLTGRGGCTASS